MSWLFSQALVEEYSEGISSDGELSAPLSGNPIQQAYLSPDKITKFSRLSRSGMTFKPLTENRGKELLTLYLAGFPARTSVLRGGGQGSPAADQDSGKRWQGLLGKYDPSTHSLKTAQCSLYEDLTPSSVTLPRWGLMRTGELYQQQTLVRHTLENESGLWPTVTATANQLAPSMQSRYANPIWPTPTAHNAKETNAPSEALRNEPTLASRVCGQLNPNWVEWLMNWPIKWSNLNGFDKQEFQRWQEASAETIQGIGQMRTMWWDSDPSQTPLGQQAVEQPEQQHSNSLPEMSWDASCKRKVERSQQGSDLFVLRDDLYIQTSKRKNLHSGMREQISLDETKIIPRVANGIAARVDRLKAIGNGQVPAVAATAFRILSEGL